MWYDRGMGKWKHRLLEKNTETHKGICAECGPVDLAYKGRFELREHPRCKNGSDRHRRSAHNPHLTRAESKALVQGATCAICGAPAGELDHNHATGATREPLCQPCNLLLGIVQDDPQRLRAAAAYLERHAERAPQP